LIERIQGGESASAASLSNELNEFLTDLAHFAQRLERIIHAETVGEPSPQNE
jgi:hypothetical protein